jgi:prepilin-type processing-associated H-X9-DG protein
VHTLKDKVYEVDRLMAIFELILGHNEHKINILGHNDRVNYFFCDGGKER